MTVLSEVFREFLYLKDINAKPSEQSVRRLIEVVGDLPIEDYTRENAKAFLASYSGQKTVHCLRHSFRDRLRDADVPLEAIDQCGGWSSVGGVGTRYGEGYSTSKLAEYLQRVAI